MPDIISATGVVGTQPTMAVVGNGLARLTFRLASTQRKFNREASGWENGETNWYTVVAFRRLAENASRSLAKGDRVVVTGRLRVSEWERDGRHGISVDILAEGIGHDLLFGTSSYSKNPSAAPAQNEQTGEAGGSSFDASDAQAKVDAGGWALPGGSADEVGGVSAEPSLGTADHADDADDTTAELAQLEFASAEPPF